MALKVQTSRIYLNQKINPINIINLLLFDSACSLAREAIQKLCKETNIISGFCPILKSISHTPASEEKGRSFETVFHYIIT